MDTATREPAQTAFQRHLSDHNIDIDRVRSVLRAGGGMEIKLDA